MNIQCNAGLKKVDHMGHIGGYGDMWFNSGAVANIISLGRLTKRFKVTFYSECGEGLIYGLITIQL